MVKFGNNNNFSFFLRLTWTILMFKILPALLPSVNQLLEFIEFSIKKIAGWNLFKIINEWLSFKNTVIVFLLSLLITLSPLIVGQIIIFFHIKLSSQFKTHLLWILDIFQQNLDYFLAIPIIMLFIFFIKLSSRYLAKRTILLLESRKRGNLRFYLILISILLLEEVMFYISTRLTITQ